MAQPQGKKVKMSQEPIIFTLRKAKPDARLFVFDQEYHVYSAVLKVGSEFFQTYLEPSGGVAPTSTSPLFKSDWYTKVDQDGTWCLTSDASVRGSDVSGFKNKEREKKAFHNLLCVIFTRNYQITDVSELNTMVQQADYYGCLPGVSNTIDGVLVNSPGLAATLESDPCALLVSAYKLRHKALFRESFILSLGPWSKPRYKNIQEENLVKLCDSAYTKLAKDVENFWISLPQLAASFHDTNTGYSYSQPYGNQFMATLFKDAGSCKDKDSKVVTPKMLRSLLGSCNSIYDPGKRRMEAILTPFLKNNLIFNKDAEAGKEGFEDYFLCFELKDEDRPWDIAQTYW